MRFVSKNQKCHSCIKAHSAGIIPRLVGLTVRLAFIDHYRHLAMRYFRNDILFILALLVLLPIGYRLVWDMPLIVAFLYGVGGVAIYVAVRGLFYWLNQRTRHK